MAEPTPIQKYIDLLRGMSARDPGKKYGEIFPTSLIQAEKLSGPEIEGPLPLPKADIAGGPYLDVLIKALNIGKAAGGGFDWNDPQSAEEITDAALAIFGGSKLLEKGLKGLSIQPRWECTLARE